MLHVISKNSTERYLWFIQKIRKTVKIKAFSRVLYWKDAYLRLGDFEHEYSAIYLKFVPKEILCVSFVYCQQLKFSEDNVQKIDCPTLPLDIFHVIRPKLSENQKIGSMNPAS